MVLSLLVAKFSVIIVVYIMPIDNAKTITWQCHASFAVDFIDNETDMPVVLGEVEDHDIVQLDSPGSPSAPTFEFSSFWFEVEIRIDTCPHDSLVYQHSVARQQCRLHGFSGYDKLVDQHHSSC